jgi:hypothetical protein
MSEEVTMSPRDWRERAKEWFAIALGGIFYLGGWAFIGLVSFQLGPWAIAAAGTLFLVDVALLFFAIEWGLRLFFSLWASTSIWLAWRVWHWWGLALALLALVLVLVVLKRFLRSRITGLTVQDLVMSSDVLTESALSAEELLISSDLLGLDAPDNLLGVLASGEFPKKAEHRALAEPERNPVDCTVFAPDRVERKESALLQVFLHAPADRKQAKAAAERFDRETKERGHRSLVLDAPIGTTFAFDVEIEGFIFHERTNTLLWTGKPQAATFGFEVPKGCKWGQHTGTLRISQGGTPVGRISFQIEVVRDARGARRRPVGKEARRYHACFCSYSSLDRAEMLKRAQGLQATGLETFIDVLKLRPGDIWNPKIFPAIDGSDLFVVIWSKNARDSKWVKKESRYALRRYKQHKSPDFRPIPVEGPPIASVPRDLRAYHFNDELLGLIRVAELEMREREKEKSEEHKPEA